MNKIKLGVSWGAPVIVLALVLGAQSDTKPVTTELASASEVAPSIPTGPTSSSIANSVSTTLQSPPITVTPNTSLIGTALTITRPTTTTLRVRKPKIELPIVDVDQDPLTPEIRAEAERNREWYRDSQGFCFQANPDTIDDAPDPTCNRKVSTDPEYQPEDSGYVYIHPVDTIQPPGGVYYEVAE